MQERRRQQRTPKLKRQHIPGYVPEAETAEALNVSVRTLRKWRREGIGPSYVKFGRQIHYSLDGRAAWLKAIETRPVRSERTS
jgi:Helix-turn-helix domain